MTEKDATSRVGYSCECLGADSNVPGMATTRELCGMSIESTLVFTSFGLALFYIYVLVMLLNPAVREQYQRYYISHQLGLALFSLRL